MLDELVAALADDPARRAVVAVRRRRRRDGQDRAGRALGSPRSEHVRRRSAVREPAGLRPRQSGRPVGGGRDDARGARRARRADPGRPRGAPGPAAHPPGRPPRAPGAGQRPRRRAGAAAAARLGRVRHRDEPQPAPRPGDPGGRAPGHAWRSCPRTESVGRAGQAATGSVTAEVAGRWRDLCARVPLALAVAAERVARAAGRPCRPTYSRSCATSRGASTPCPRRRPHHRRARRAVVVLPGRSTDEESRLFRLLAAGPRPRHPAPAAAALVGLPGRGRPALLDRLVAAHLLLEKAAGRFEQHDLIRAYAAELAGTRTRLRAARVLSWYHATALVRPGTLTDEAAPGLRRRARGRPARLSPTPRAPSPGSTTSARTCSTSWRTRPRRAGPLAWQVAAALAMYFTNRRPWDHRRPDVGARAGLRPAGR